MRAVYPGSVNTLRVITQNFNGIPEISVVAFRMGRNGTFVDNSASGGISLKVDTETGRIDRLAIDVDNNKAFEKHPDTGFKFDGFVINDWSTIKSSILDFAAKASDFPDVGWDIAIQEDKAIVIELNLNYGIDMQAVVGGLRRRLHIEPFAAPKKVKIA
jgi:hypothetical protein